MTVARYRWVIVAAGCVLGCLAEGSVFALPVFLQPIARETGWSITGVSAAMTIGFLAMAFASMAWGNLSDRWGPRPIVTAGALLIIAGLLAASHAPSLLLFQLSFGLIMGIAGAAIFAPMMATVTGWFSDHTSLAVSLVSAGMGVAPLVMSPFAAWLVAHYDWRTSMTVIAGLVTVVMLPLTFLIRRPPGLTQARPADAPPPMSTGRALRSPQFFILLGTMFFCCATHSGPIFHTVSYAITCGIAPMAAVTIYSVEGLAGMFGRVGFGLLGDRFGAKPVLVAGLLAQAFGALGYFFAHGIGEFYGVAVLFGFIYAGIMPLYSVIARDNFPLSMLGTVIGGLAMAGSFGMASGPVIGGVLHDVFHSYAGLYLTAFVMGLGAFAISLTFRPFSQTEPDTVRA
jgi:MFS family permease